MPEIHGKKFRRKPTFSCLSPTSKPKEFICVEIAREIGHDR